MAERRSYPALFRTLRPSLTWLSLAIPLLWHSFSLSAGELKGRVTAQGEAQKLSRATIQVQSLANPETSPLYRATTNAQGDFVLSNLPPGLYRLRVSHPDYAILEMQVRVTDGMSQVEVALPRARVPRAPVVEVVERAVSGETPTAFSNLTRQELDERLAIKDTPMAIAELPSATFYSENGNGVGYNYMTLRGFDQRRISVMIDGVPQNDPEDHNVYWINFFDLAGSLEDIQVQRGAGAGLYGPPAIGGSINLVTRQLSADPWQRLELGYGGFNTQRYTAEVNSGLIKNRLVFYGRFSHLRSDGYRDWSWSRFYRGYLGGAVYGPHSSLKVQLYGGPQDDALSYYGIPKAWNEDETLRKSNWGAPISGRKGDLEHFNQTHLDVVHEYAPNDRFQLKNTLFLLSGVGYFDFDGSWGDMYYYRLDPVYFPGYSQLETWPNTLSEPSMGTPLLPWDTMVRAFVNNKQAGWLSRGTFHQGSIGELNAGLELRVHRSLHWGRIQEGSFVPILANQVVGAGPDRHYYAFRGGKDILSGYLNQKLRLNRWRLEGNLQGVAQQYRLYDEAYAENDFTVPYLFLNPRLGATYALSPQASVFASVSRTSREPRLKELYDAENASWGAVPMLDTVKPEHLTDLELGGQVSLERARLNVNGFYMDFRDEIVKTGGLDQFGQPYNGNAERTRHMGLEVEGAARLLDSLDIAGNVTYSHNRFVKFTEYLDDGVAVSRDGNPIAASPDWLGNLRLTWRRWGAVVSLDGKYVGRQYVDNSRDTWDDGSAAQGEKVVDAYMLVGASAGYRFPEPSRLKGLSLGLEASNLLNQKVIQAGYGEDNFFPAAPFSLFARARFEH